MAESWLESPRATGIGQVGRDKIMTMNESSEASAAESRLVYGVGA